MGRESLAIDVKAGDEGPLAVTCDGDALGVVEVEGVVGRTEVEADRLDGGGEPERVGVADGDDAQSRVVALAVGEKDAVWVDGRGEGVGFLVGLDVGDL